ncbi:MAG: hypothetical protein LDL11_01705 [Desulfarculus sp.]|nr:hypothetical protein [Desulfarculus sp.]
MSTLDIRTLALATSMILMVLSLHLAYFRYTSDSLHGVGSWALGNFAGAVGLWLLSQRHFWPDWLTVVAANMLLGLFAAKIYQGLRRFLGRPPRVWVTMVLVAGLGVGQVLFTYAHPSVNARIVLISLYFCGIALGCVRLLARATFDQAPHNRLLLISFGVLALVHATRVVFTLTAGAEPTSFMTAGPFHAMVILIDSALHCLVNIGLVFMCVRRMEAAVRRANAELRQLSGLLPICANCKRIRDDRGYWHQVEQYIQTHSEAEFTHGICPECMRRLYPNAADSILGPEIVRDLARPESSPQP